MDLASLGKIIVTFALILFVIGGAFYLLGKIAGVGRLPGDIYIKRGNFAFYFPLGASIVISILLTILLNLFFLLRR